MSNGALNLLPVTTYNPLQLTWNISAKEEIVTVQMLLNGKYLDMLGLHNECG